MKELLSHLHSRWAVPLLNEFNESLLLKKCKEYTSAIEKKCGGVLTHIIGFIDGTLRPIARYLSLS